MPMAMNIWLSENVFIFPNALEKAQALKTTLWAFIKLLLSAFIHFVSF